MIEKEKIGSILSKNASQAPDFLAEKITTNISIRMRRAAEIKAYVFGLTSLGAVAALIVTGRKAVMDLGSSGTWKVFSLMFSDFHTVMANFTDYAFGIVESLPVLSIVYALSSAVVLLVLAAIAFNYFRKTESIKINYFNKNGFKHA